MSLSTQERADRARARMIETAKCYQLGTYSRKFVAPLFQKMIRAEYAAEPAGCVTAIEGGELSRVPRQIGECVCVTCGRVGNWCGNYIGGGPFHTGHFLAGRSFSILYEEENVAPQCALCNQHRSGEQQLFRKWMEAVRGRETIERLERLKAQPRSFSREELVDMRIEYDRRLKVAVGIIGGVA